MSVRDETVRDLLFLDPEPTGAPSNEGQVRKHNNDLVVYIGGSVKSLTASSSGISEPDHEALDTLVHDINESSYDEITRSGRRVTKVTTWSDSSKVLKIREVDLSYTGSRLAQSITYQYDASGSVSQTLTETFSYIGGSRRVSSITRVKT